MKQVLLLLLLGAALPLAGCAPAVVGGVAAGGYKAVTDERTTQQLTDDIALSNSITDKIASDSLLNALRIDVDVVLGYATLSGVVKTTEQANHAVELAQSVPGVKGVRNNLQAGERSFSGSVNDSWIASKVKSQLLVEPGIRSLNIDVDVYRGVATLTGLVSSKAERDRALAIARGTEGVVRVTDNLTVAR